ncbi:MAG: prepilin-type N-terminal cleavage/methylation domain-containing protein [Symbiopectobacterium sp.]|uniref:prepilin-type N-terminal cleavage/methylation domain-containing protein n=1 Tax=Symbiopectobacterium sp. TaxID=2952789 RepID=UPI0039E7F02C
METAIAALLFAISVLGLLQYHQRLQQAFVHQWQQRQAWHLAYQQLAIYAGGQGGGASALLERNLSPGWHLHLTEQRQSASYWRVSSTVTTPQHYQARLHRWFCFTSANRQAVREDNLR